MGGAARKKSLRNARKLRNSANPPPSSSDKPVPTPPSPSSPNPNPNPSGSSDLSESQLEDLLLDRLDKVYKDAISHFTSLGFDDATALSAVLSNGHFYGSADPVTNVIRNASVFFTVAPRLPPAFPDLVRLKRYGVSRVVSLLCRCRPKLDRRLALWCYLAGDLHIGRACLVPAPGGVDDDDLDRIRSMKNRPVGYFLARMHPSKSGSGAQEAEILSLDEEAILEGVTDEETESILELSREIRELEAQIKERKEWAQKKVIEAAKKMSSVRQEMDLLRMEVEAEDQQNRRPAEVKEEVADDATLMRMLQMESEVRKAYEEDNRLSAEIRSLEMVNAEIKAETEAERLNGSELEKTYMEMEKKEKKSRKKLQALEKQSEKLQEEVAEVKEEITELQQELEEVNQEQQEMEVKWRQEQRAKEQAVALVEEEHRVTEAAEASIKQKREALQRKIEQDVQCYKDDILRLEEEMSRLEALAGSSQLDSSTGTSRSGDAEKDNTPGDAEMKMLEGLNRMQVSCSEEMNHRECLFCLKEDIHVLFLPCAHQVLCTSCSEDHEKLGAETCPSCQARIERRIHVFGSSS